LCFILEKLSFNTITGILKIRLMRKFIQRSLLLLGLISLAFFRIGQAQIVLYEDFNYTPPAYIGGNGGAGSSSNNWTTHSVTSGQTTTIDVINGNLSYPGIVPPSGNKVSMFGNNNLTSRDINRPITATGNVLYFSVLLNVIDNSGLTTTGDYFMHFGATAGNSVTIFGARTGVKVVNSGLNYRFMILNTSGGTTTFTDFPLDLNFGTTYLVVVKYDKSTSPTTASLWVNPTDLGGAEPAGSVTNTSGTSAFATFASICLRNNAATPKVEIDEIRIGATWAEVTPTTAQPVTPTVITTIPVINITYTSATGGGNVTSDGGTAITARGVCYATTPNPTISGLHTTEPGTTGVFTSDITGLSPQTTYYLKAYATNSIGTGYGEQTTFTTLCDPLIPVVNFYADKVNIMVGESVNFFDQSLYCPTSWAWTFVGGEPGSSTLQNPTGIVYNYPGVFNVCMMATNNYGTGLDCKMGYITVTAPPAPLNARIVITEIMYNPPESGVDTLEFIELYNNDTAAINMENFYFSKGIIFTFPNIIMPAHSYLIVAKSDTAMLNTFGVTSLQWAEGSSLNNGGEPVVLNDPLGFTADSVTYDDALPWDTLADGRGPSLELCNPDADNSNPLNWRAAIEFAAINGAGDTIWATPLTGCSYPPVAAFVASDTAIMQYESVIFSDSSSSNSTGWVWTFEGGTPETYTGKAPPPVQYNSMGAFNVTLEVFNVAGHNTLVKSDYIEVGPSGIHGITDPEGLRIFPNPTTGQFTIQCDANGNTIVKILNQLGNVVFETRINQQKTVLAPPGLAPGIYFIRVIETETGKTKSSKLIVQ
jgi:PKD repeat protein